MLINVLFSYKSHDYAYRIKFTDEIMAEKERNIGKNILRYKWQQWKKIESYDNMNHSIHIV